MRVIGLTGGIASGKTTVADMLAARGAAVIDTDVLAREIVRPGMPAYKEIVAAFGAKVLGSDGTLDRAVLGALVFADSAALAQLNRFTHTRIRDEMLARLATLKASDVPPSAAILVIPLLFENGLEGLVEESWVVDVPESAQRARLIARDHFDEAAANRRIASQMPRHEKIARATRTIRNDGLPADLAAEVSRVWHEAGLG